MFGLILDVCLSSFSLFLNYSLSKHYWQKSLPEVGITVLSFLPRLFSLFLATGPSLVSNINTEKRNKTIKKDEVRSAI